MLSHAAPSIGSSRHNTCTTLFLNVPCKTLAKTVGRTVGDPARVCHPAPGTGRVCRSGCPPRERKIHRGATTRGNTYRRYLRLEVRTNATNTRPSSHPRLHPRQRSSCEVEPRQQHRHERDERIKSLFKIGLSLTLTNPRPQTNRVDDRPLHNSSCTRHHRPPITAHNESSPREGGIAQAPQEQHVVMLSIMYEQVLRVESSRLPPALHTPDL